MTSLEYFYLQLVQIKHLFVFRCDQPFMIVWHIV